ncbi:MAG: sulfatase-like hydrolase/transferase [Pirellulaceae bacterium]
MPSSLNDVRRTTIHAVCVLLVGWGVASGAKPNIVLIMADDLGYGDLSCYDGWIETPNIDALSRTGIRFTDFHTSGTVCSPTRAGLMTGRYQQRAGIGGVVFARLDAEQHYHGLQDSEYTLAEMCREQGYKTAIFGKWHLGYYPPYNPVNHGFDVFRGYVSGNVDFFSHVDQAGVFDWWHNEQPSDEKGYTTHLINKHAVEFIETSEDAPFFLYVPHEAPHYPYQGPADTPIREVGSTVKLKGERKDIKNAYREMVTEMDTGVGEIMLALERAGKIENTIVIFMSDNGANKNGDNGELRGFKGSVWEGGHRVPAMISWPGHIAPTVVCEFVTSLDWMPTLAAILKSKEDQARPFDGISQMELLHSGKSRDAHERVFVWKGTAVRRGSYKWVTEKGVEYLFDLESDPNESKDIIQDHPELAKQLNRIAQNWKNEMSETASKQPSKNELFKLLGKP